MKYIIHQPWGGLGDNLQYSTLPEQLSKQGHEVYIHGANAYRNPEIFELVWQPNPFVKGISWDHPNCGWIGVDPQRPKWGINKWEMLFGADPSEGIPKIYWTPPKVTGLENTVLVDLNYSSCAHTESIVMPIVYEQVAKRWPNCEIRQVRFTQEKVSSKKFLSKFQVLPVVSIWDYCSKIASCRAILTLLTGSSPLASAIRRFNPYPEILTLKLSNYTEGQIFPNAEFIDAG
jgi:hypothetical protein